MITELIHDSQHNLSISIGAEPRNHNLAELEAFNSIINVSDSPGITFIVHPKQIRLWFPIIEFGEWSYTSLFGFKRAMDALVTPHSSTYVHCHAGLNRSPALVALWLASTGREILMTDKHKQLLTAYTKRGHLPPKINDLYKEMEQNREAPLFQLGDSFLTSHPQWITPYVKDSLSRNK